MGYLEGFGITMRQHRLFGGERVTTEYSGGRRAKKKSATTLATSTTTRSSRGPSGSTDATC